MRAILGIILTVAVVVSALPLQDEEKDDQQVLSPLMQLRLIAQKAAIDSYKFGQDTVHVSGSQSKMTLM